MKYAAAILIVSLVFYVSYSLLAQGHTIPVNDVEQMGNSEQTEQTDRKKSDVSEEDKEEMDYEDIFTSDQETFHGELFQKELPPVTKKQEIVWAFRLSETNPFL